MTVSTALQKAIFERLTTYAPLVALIGQRVYDDPPTGAVYPFVSFGPMDAVPLEVECFEGATQNVQIDVWSDSQAGQVEAKEITDHVKTALHKFTANLSDGALIGMRVTLMRVIPDPEKHITHGVLQIEADVED